MRYPQLLVYEKDGRLAELVRRDSDARKWSLREPRRAESCLRLLQSGSASVLLLKIGTNPVRELALLERALWVFPDTVSVVVSEENNPALAGLAWALGASLVLYPSWSRSELVEVLAGLMELAIHRRRPTGRKSKSAPQPSEVED